MGLVRHHIKYKDIHGYNQTVMMEKGEHQKLHYRLRREGKCNIPANELAKISSKEYSKEYYKKYRYEKTFSLTIEKNIQVHQRIILNLQTGNITVCSRFYKTNKLT